MEDPISPAIIIPFFFSSAYPSAIVLRQKTVDCKTVKNPAMRVSLGVFIISTRLTGGLRLHFFSPYMLVSQSENTSKSLWAFYLLETLDWRLEIFRVFMTWKEKMISWACWMGASSELQLETNWPCSSRWCMQRHGWRRWASAACCTPCQKQS